MSKREKEPIDWGWLGGLLAAIIILFWHTELQPLLIMTRTQECPGCLVFENEHFFLAYPSDWTYEEFEEGVEFSSPDGAARLYIEATPFTGSSEEFWEFSSSRLEEFEEEFKVTIGERRETQLGGVPALSAGITTEDPEGEGEVVVCSYNGLAYLLETFATSASPDAGVLETMKESIRLVPSTPTPSPTSSPTPTLTPTPTPTNAVWGTVVVDGEDGIKVLKEKGAVVAVGFYWEENDESRFAETLVDIPKGSYQLPYPGKPCFFKARLINFTTGEELARYPFDRIEGPGEKSFGLAY